MEVYFKATQLSEQESLYSANERVKREAAFVRALMWLCDRHCVRCLPLEARAPEDLELPQVPRAPAELELPENRAG